MKLVTAVESDDELRALRALRRSLAEKLEDCDSLRDYAALSLRLQDTLKRISELKSVAPSQVSSLDEIRARRLDQHHDRLNDHGSRLGSVETAQAIITATTRRRTPWYLVVGAVVGIITGTAGLFGVLAYLSQISTALAG